MITHIFPEQNSGTYVQSSGRFNDDLGIRIQNKSRLVNSHFVGSNFNPNPMQKKSLENFRQNYGIYREALHRAS